MTNHHPPTTNGQAVVIGPDADGLGDALADYLPVTHVDGTGTRDQLVDAGLGDGDMLVVTDAGLATSIPIARELGDVRIVVYARDSLPEFARGKQALIVDPALIAAETVAEELVAD